MKRNINVPAVTDGQLSGHAHVAVMADLTPGCVGSAPPLAFNPPQLVGLSGLGWAFVAVAVCWELFAFTFSQRAGWGWDKGAFFFAWGLGVLALGFYLTTTRTRPPVSRIFLGMNILVVSILSMVVTAR